MKRGGVRGGGGVEIFFFYERSGGGIKEYHYIMHNTH